MSRSNRPIQTQPIWGSKVSHASTLPGSGEREPDRLGGERKERSERVGERVSVLSPGRPHEDLGPDSGRPKAPSSSSLSRPTRHSSLDDGPCPCPKQTWRNFGPLLSSWVYPTETKRGGTRGASTSARPGSGCDGVPLVFSGIRLPQRGDPPNPIHLFRRSRDPLPGGCLGGLSLSVSEGVLLGRPRDTSWTPGFGEEAVVGLRVGSPVGTSCLCHSRASDS